MPRTSTASIAVAISCRTSTFTARSSVFRSPSARRSTPFRRPFRISMHQASAPRFGGIGWETVRRPRIGLVWSGKPTHKNDHNRSIALPRLKPLLSVAGTQFVSLQREYRASDLAALDQLPIRRLDGLLTDFADTAAVIGELDLVIAVDTAAAHLAGAMAKPAMAACAACAGLALVARPHRQPLVSDSKAVSTAANRRLGRGNCSNGKSARGLCEDLRHLGQVTMQVNFSPD